MKKLALAKLESGDLATTASVLTQVMRLHQICCGFLQPDEGDTTFSKQSLEGTALCV